MKEKGRKNTEREWGRKKSVGKTKNKAKTGNDRKDKK